jgi:hypothetical protein
MPSVVALIVAKDRRRREVSIDERKRLEQTQPADHRHQDLAEAANSPAFG